MAIEVWTTDPTVDFPRPPPITVVDVEHEVLVDLVSGPYPLAAGLELLRRELDRASIVLRSQAPPDLVRIGSNVRLVNGDLRRFRHLKLALPTETGELDAVSVTSGLGAAMLGLRPGQVFSWRGADRRRRTIQVLDVEAPVGPRIVRPSR